MAASQEKMTKTQKRKLRQSRKAEDKRRRLRRKNVLRWCAAVSFVLGALLLGYRFFQSPVDSSGKLSAPVEQPLNDNGEAESGLLRLAASERYLGVVSVIQGPVTAEIALVNIGDGNLTIRGLDTSCGCTSASIVNEGVEGPRFYMAQSGRNRRNWQTVIKPEGQAKLKIYYDPTVHPDERGKLTRLVRIFSDDPNTPIREARIKVVQVG